MSTKFFQRPRVFMDMLIGVELHKQRHQALLLENFD